MSKIGVTTILIRAEEDSEFRNALHIDVDKAVVGYDVTKEEKQEIKKLLEKIVQATKENEAEIFKTIVRPLVPKKLPDGFASAKCCGGGGAMSNYAEDK